MEHVQNIVEMSRRVQLINICLSVDLKSITIIDAVLCAHEHPILLLSFSLLSINLSVVALTKKNYPGSWLQSASQAKVRYQASFSVLKV